MHKGQLDLQSSSLRTSTSTKDVTIAQKYALGCVTRELWTSRMATQPQEHARQPAHLEVLAVQPERRLHGPDLGHVGRHLRQALPDTVDVDVRQRRAGRLAQGAQDLPVVPAVARHRYRFLRGVTDYWIPDGYEPPEH